MRLVWRAMALSDRELTMDHIAADNPEAAIAPENKKPPLRAAFCLRRLQLTAVGQQP